MKSKIHIILEKPVHFETLLYAVWVSGILEIGEYYIEGSSDFGQVYDTETTYPESEHNFVSMYSCDKCDTWYEVFHDKKILVDQKKRHPE